MAASAAHRPDAPRRASSPSILHPADTEAPHTSPTLGAVRSGSGIEPAAKAPEAAGRRVGPGTSDVVVQAVAEDELAEEHDPFMWFVDLFVQEYALEARSSRATAPPADRSR